MFATRVLYVIDMRLQMTPTPGKHRKRILTHPLYFSRMYYNIIHNMTFRANLPSSLIDSKKRKKENDHDNDRDWGRDDDSCCKVNVKNLHTNP
jgi:hypothetical protein